MKAIVLPLALACGLLAGLSTARAQFSPISVQVDQSQKSEINKEDRFTKTETRTLKLSINNSAAAPADLSVKYTYFGRDVKGHDVVTINAGQQAVQAKPMGTVSVDIPAANTTYSEEHYPVATGGAKAKPGKKIDATGSKFIGYAVQIFQGDKMVAEAYDPLSMKDEVGKTVAAPVAIPPKKK